MYDSSTAAFIASIPRLGSVQPADLPNLLTEVYTAISVARLRLGELSGSELEEISDEISTLQELSASLEIYAVLSESSEDRQAAAFVSATAHSLLYQAGLRVGRERALSMTTTDRISFDLSAALLFLIAGYPADAVEVVQFASDPDGQSPRAVAIRGIRSLARGRLAELRFARATPVATTLQAQAEDALWMRVVKAMRGMAALMLGRDVAEFEGASDPGSELVSVESLSQAVIDYGDSLLGPVYSVYPAVLHVATLLRAAWTTLRSSNITNIEPPPATDASFFASFVKRRAAIFPYLWENHLRAITAGLLNPGTSAVVTFPTGAGKTTLAHLKIASCLGTQKKVLYLVPTHSLASQVASDLRAAFPDISDIEDSRIDDPVFAAVELALEEDINVMTPERALLLVSLEPAKFNELGLLVFDECHLMHFMSHTDNRRSTDAMLALLALVQAAPDCDVVLISAMLSNCRELSNWISDVTQRPCLPLDLDWKPTRQARGCVIYHGDDVTQLEEKIRERKRLARRERGPDAKPRAADQVGLAVAPHGLFALELKWTSNSLNDYRVLPVIDTPVPLSLNSFWQLTANRNKVTAQLAVQAVKQGLRVVVFSQNKKFCYSIFTSMFVEDAPFVPNADEKRLLEMALCEVGNRSDCYIPTCAVGCHHGLLISPERLVMESAFRRHDGIRALVATPTIAQGINLPADAVFLAGDDRFDSNVEQLRMLSAHELLNAAGRAGRAGHAAHGVVMIVPGKVIRFSMNEKFVLDDHWFELKKIFLQDDRCVSLSDPLEHLLDIVISDPDNELGNYFVAHLPPASADGSNEAAQRLMMTSLTAFRSRQAGKSEEFEQVVRRALMTRPTSTDTEASKEIEFIAASAGVGVDFIIELREFLLGLCTGGVLTLWEWVDRVVGWIAQSPNRMSLVVGDGYEKEFAWLKAVLQSWMEGVPLSGLEAAGPEKAARMCPRARVLANSNSGKIGFMFGLASQVFMTLDPDERPDDGGLWPVLPALVKEGFDNREKLALFYLKREDHWTRVYTHKMYKIIKPWIHGGLNDDSSFLDTVSRVRRGLISYEQDNPSST